MATPYDLFLRFQVTKGIDDVTNLNGIFKDLNLDPPSQENFDTQYDLVLSNLPRTVINQIESKRYEGDFLKWMTVLELSEIWCTEKQYLEPTINRKFVLLYGIHEDPHLRLCINALLIKNVPVKDIAELVNIKFSAMLKEEHIGLYRKYFFDPRRMTRKDWKSYLGRFGGKELNIYFTALSEPVEVLKTELELPSSVNVAEPLQFLLMKSYQKAKLYLENSTKESNAEARAWINQVISLSEKYQKFRTSDKTDFAKQLQMEFEFVNHDFVTPDDSMLQDLKKEVEMLPGDDK